MIKKIMVCDFCGKEINETDDFPETSIDLDCGREYHLDLCYDCYQELVAYIDKRITTDKSQINNTTVTSVNYSNCNCYDNGRCNGTRERDECSCDGDELNCSFYGYVKVRGAERYYNSLPLKYKCPYWDSFRERRINGAQYEICNNSMENDIVSCHGDKRLCQFGKIRESTSEFSDKVKEFIK